MTRELKPFERPCGYGCGQPWRPWAGSKLRGHAKCAVSAEGKEEILQLIERFPRAGLKRVADDLGVTGAVLRAWVRQALEARRLRGAA